MNLQTIGHLIAERRRAKGLTLSQLAAQAAVGRSTLAALEAGKLPELGLERVARLCAAVDLVLEARPLELKQPLMAHRHLSEVAGRELTKAAIDDIITRGTISTWRKLLQAMNADKTGRIARRVTDVAQTLGKRDPKARAFAALLRKLPGKPHDAAAESPRTRKSPTGKPSSRMPRCCRRKSPPPSWWEVPPRPCTPAIAFPLTMITSSKTWQRTTTRPFAPWNPSPAGTHTVELRAKWCWGMSTRSLQDCATSDALRRSKRRRSLCRMGGAFDCQQLRRRCALRPSSWLIAIPPEPISTSRHFPTISA